MSKKDKESAAYKSGEFEDTKAEEMVPYSESTLRREDFLSALEYRYQQGLIEGRKEAGRLAARLEVAGKMKQNGMSLDTIMFCTGLSEKQISDL